MGNKICQWHQRLRPCIHHY